jgi:hypothetical protein
VIRCITRFINPRHVDGKSAQLPRDRPKPDAQTARRGLYSPTASAHSRAGGSVEAFDIQLADQPELE